MQGVVRDAVALCRSFGLRVAGLYPKLIVPFSYEDMESFAKTVGRVVLVESGQTQGYWDRLRATFSFEPAVLSPQPGKSLTPMDIFLREGLGAL
jgi:pyruvate/2-oxoacid:ferredoxin oxidoreductase alpha subunit